jgi:hypothetical protein
VCDDAMNTYLVAIIYRSGIGFSSALPVLFANCRRLAQKRKFVSS